MTMETQVQEAEVIELRPPPAKQAPTIEAELRAALGEAIDRRNGADERAFTMKATARRAEQLCSDARRHVDTFRSQHDAKRQEAREDHVRACSEAIRHEHPVPSAPTPAAIDIAALEAAESQHDALQVSAAYLGLEAQDATAAAGKAAAAVHVAAVAVMDHDGKRIVSELLASRDIFWKLTEAASGFFLLDEKRPNGPQFAILRNETKIKLDKQSALIAENPEFIEHWKLARHEGEVNAAAERQWQDYHRRLCLDPAAAFDASEESEQ